MKIKIILPNSSPELIKDRIHERKAIAGKGTKIDMICLPKGPVSVENATDEARAIPHILDEIKRAEQEKYDAVTIDCAMDPFPRAIKEAVKIPVVIGGEASRLLATALGDKFSVVTMLPSAAEVIRHNVEASGMGSRLASVRAIDTPVLELADHAKVKEIILQEARIAVEEDGAHVIILGCAGMSRILTYVQEKLQVPVIDPGGAALKIAETLVSMGLAQSKRCFPTPPSKEIK
ncbi:MAG: aspartate/glutamate racemase family protein [Nitrospinaceae bacterium]|nr:aspartate/glutamate racemase family protein [Nitrospinaceae bacterium]